MAHHARPHSYISAGHALTGTSIDELIRPGLHLAFPLPSEAEPVDEMFRRLLEALAQCSSPGGQAKGRA